MLNWIKPGRVVVCVNGGDDKAYQSFADKGINIHRLIVGQRYIIRSFYATGSGAIGITLFGMTNSNHPGITQDIGYAHENFEPVYELPACLTNILKKPFKPIRKDQFDKGKSYDPI